MIAGLGIALFAFLPERPHMWVVETTLAYSVLSFLTVLLRISRGPAQYINDSTLSFQGRLERLKANVSLWRQITICGTFGYLVLAIVEMIVVWNVALVMVSNRGEQILLFNVSLCSLLLYSVFVVLGPLKEAFGLTVEHIQKLSTTKE